ncbi:hypothetical protein [Catellatospora sichuanensis]|uniref:hypothetical protein n=1 Tax=Catellatospora sichuanensis TaxID=1969805 RepID=UPI0011824426|nr:hypothetical protein [Catellatospora sichuanensis]
MSNSRMYPLLRTEDSAEAYGLAQRLVSLAIAVRHVAACVWTSSHDLARYHRVPGAQCQAETTPELAAVLLDALGVQGVERLIEARDWDDGTSTVYCVDPRSAEPLRAVPPVRVAVQLARSTPGEADRELVAAVRTDPGHLHWEVDWPALPDLDLPASLKHGGVEITFNTDEPWSDVVTGRHTVWVHDGRHGELRAPWLAAAAGLADPRVIGPVAHGI